MLTLEQTGAWIVLHADISEDHRIALDQSNDWQWDVHDYPEYSRVPSKNGYYIPSARHAEIWPIIREWHFKFLETVAVKFSALMSKSQRKHSSMVLNYLRHELQCTIPEPEYDTDAGSQSTLLPEELIDGQTYTEGARKPSQAIVYERNPKARRACINYYGTICQVCGFDFEAVYGQIGRGIIHVHHRKPISEIGEKYKINPIQDLIPVCPNCHTIIHRKNPAYTVEEVKNLLTRKDVLKL